MKESEKDHTEGGSGTQIGVRIEEKPSIIVKFRLPRELHSAYQLEAKRREIASVDLYCKLVCTKLYPAMAEERIRLAVQHVRNSTKYHFTSDEIEEAKRRLRGEIKGVE